MAYLPIQLLYLCQLWNLKKTIIKCQLINVLNLGHLKKFESIMELLATALTFLLIFTMALSFDNQKICKAICSLSKSRNVDLFLDTLVHPIKLSKTLYQECGIKVRFLSNISDVEDFLVLSINQQNNEKETI